MTELLISLGLTLLGLLGWIANLIGTPGNWLLVVTAIGCAWFAPEAASYSLNWSTVSLLLFLAALGEILEFLASAVGAGKRGGSKRATALAIVGSIAGASVGLVMGVGIPIPIVGSLVSSILLGACGAFAGAVIGERWIGKPWEEAIDTAVAAFQGRLLGTVGKALCGTVACGIFLIACWI